VTADALSVAAAINAGSGNDILAADAINIQSAITANGGIDLHPVTTSADIGIGAAGNFNLTAAELALLNSTGTVTIGASGGSGNVTVGTVNLASETFDLTIRGGATTFTGTLTTPAGKTLTLATGAVSGPSGDFAVSGTNLKFATTADVGTAALPLVTQVSGLSAGSVTGDLFLRNNGSLTTLGTLSATGSLSVALPSLTTQAGHLNATAVNLELLGVGSLNTGGQSITDLLHSGSGKLTVAGNLTLAGDFTQADGAGDVDITGRTVLVAGDWSWGNSGNLVSAGSTVRFNGSNQMISGATNFYNLTKTTAVADTLTFEAGTIQTVSGVLTLKGAANQKLSLRSSAPGSEWSINPQGFRSVSQVDVQDSFNLNAYPVAASLSSDGGGNTNWAFSSSSPTIDGVVAAQIIGDNQTVQPFADVVIAKPDGPDQLLTATLILSNAANGAFSASSLTAAGVTPLGFGVYTLSGSAAELTGALQQLVFVPTLNQLAPGGTTVTIFTLSIADGIAPAANDSTTSVVAYSVADAPTILDMVIPSLAENSNGGAVVGTVSSTDPDLSDSPTYSLSDDAGGRFRIVGNQVQVAPGATLDFETTPSITFRVRATDRYNASSERAFTLNLTNVNEAPVNRAPATATADRNKTLVLGSALGVADPEGNNVQVKLVANKGVLTSAGGAGVALVGNNTAALTLTGSPAALAPVLAAAGYKPPAGYTGAATITMTSTEQNAGGLKDTDLIAVTVVNNAPVNTAPTNLTLFRNGTVPLTGLGVSDVQGDTLRVTLTATKGVLTSTGGAGVTLAGNNTAILTLTGTPTALAPVLGGVVFKATAGASGAATITMKSTEVVSSGVALSDTDTISLSIVNRAPVLATSTFTYTATAGTPLSVQLFSDPDADPLTLSLTLVPTKGTVAFTKAGVFTYTAPLTARGSTVTFTVKASDGLATTAPVTITINVI
jgi:hypothetical protein